MGFRRGRGANSGGIERGFREGFHMKVTILREFALLEGEGENICAERGVHAETRVGVETMACWGNSRELRMGGCGMHGMGEKSQTTKTFISHAKECGLFLDGNGGSLEDS